MDYVLPRFMNLRTDYAFKKIFGTEENKHILLQFLNELFAPDYRIISVKFENKEVLPFKEGRRRVIYDVYCTTQTGSHIVIEMQQFSQRYFMNRMLVYTGMGMVHQARRGKWNFKTNPVFGVFVTGFSLHGLPPKLVRRAGITDLEDGDMLTSAQRWYVVDLSQMQRQSLDECENDLERWTFFLKNMNKFEKRPEGYERFYPLFDAAETSSMAAEDIVAYSESEQRLIDEEVARQEYGEEKHAQGRREGLKEGRREGLKEGKKEGIKEGILQMARKLKLAGQSEDFIMSITGLSPEALSAL